MLRGVLWNWVVEDRTSVQRPSLYPSVSALLCAVLVLVSGFWTASVGLVLGAGVCAVAAWYAYRMRAPFDASPSRGLLVVAPWVALGPTATVAIARTDACVELAPGVFLLVWPLVVFACVLGARAVVAVARLEGWPRFEPSTVPALWGVCAAAVAFHLLGASVWSCGGGGGAWGMWWALGVVAALALAHLSRAGRKGGV